MSTGIQSGVAVALEAQPVLLATELLHGAPGFLSTEMQRASRHATISPALSLDMRQAFGGEEATSGYIHQSRDGSKSRQPRRGQVNRKSMTPKGRLDFHQQHTFTPFAPSHVKQEASW